MWKKYSRPVVELVVLIARGWGVTNQELFQVPFERKWRALGNHPTNQKKTWLKGRTRVFTKQVAVGWASC